MCNILMWLSVIIVDPCSLIPFHPHCTPLTYTYIHKERRPQRPTHHDPCHPTYAPSTNLSALSQLSYNSELHHEEMYMCNIGDTVLSLINLLDHFLSYVTSCPQIMNVLVFYSRTRYIHIYTLGKLRAARWEIKVTGLYDAQLYT